MVLNHKGGPSGPKALTSTSVTVAFGNVDNAAVKRVTATLAGLRTTDRVVVNLPAGVAANLGLGGARVSAADEIEVALINPTAATITAGNIVCNVVIQRFS